MSYKKETSVSFYLSEFRASAAFIPSLEGSFGVGDQTYCKTSHDLKKFSQTCDNFYGSSYTIQAVGMEPL